MGEQEARQVDWVGHGRAGCGVFTLGQVGKVMAGFHKRAAVTKISEKLERKISQNRTFSGSTLMNTFAAPAPRMSEAAAAATSSVSLTKLGCSHVPRCIGSDAIVMWKVKQG